MPNGLAAAMREAVLTENVTEDELEKTPWGKTGFVGVIEIKGKYQARIQVPGDGRGGTSKRRQYALPGLFDTPRDTAIIRAGIMKGMKEKNNGKLFVPPKQDKPHKKRTVKQSAAVPQPSAAPALNQSPMSTAMAIPFAMPMWNVPFATVSPLPIPRFRRLRTLNFPAFA